jgi:hypothetical protein
MQAMWSSKFKSSNRGHGILGTEETQNHHLNITHTMNKINKHYGIKPAYKKTPMVPYTF